MKHCSHRSPEQITVYTSSDALPQAWDAFVPETHFLSRQTIRTTEFSHLPDLEYFYVFITDKAGAPLAACYFQLLHIRQNHLNPISLKNWQRFLWRSFAGTFRPKLLVAGHLFRHDVQSFFHADTVSPFDVYGLYRKAIDKVLDISGASAVLVKDTSPELVTYFQNYAPQYTMLRNDISMEMELPMEWQSIADYEKALKHKYAQRFRKIRQHWSQLNVKELSAQDVLKNQSHLYELYKQVTDKQQVRLGYLSPECLPLLKQVYADELKIWGVYENEQLVAFFSAWLKPDAFDMFYIGFDYNRNADLQLYFNILFFSIEQAIVYRKPKLILGRTALDAKARLGCKPRYLNTFVFIPNRYTRQFVQRLQNANSREEGEWESRHPFKH